ncbi:unnamed protein product, partial [Pylaiella littoralis]
RSIFAHTWKEFLNAPFRTSGPPRPRNPPGVATPSTSFRHNKQSGVTVEDRDSPGGRRDPAQRVGSCHPRCSSR